MNHLYNLSLFLLHCHLLTNLIDRQSPTFFGTPLPSLWDMRVVGNEMIFLAWEAVVYSILVLLVEHIQASPALFTFFTKNRMRVLEAFSRFGNARNRFLAQNYP